MSGHRQSEFRSHKRPITDRRLGVLLYSAIFIPQPDCVLVLLVLPFPSLALAPAADHASNGAVVWVTVAGCAGRTRGVNQASPP
jgi:hypothetical protein